MKKIVILLVLCLASVSQAVINWDTQITNVNVQSKRANITFTRTDTDTNDVWTKSYTNVIIETQEQRLSLLNQVWDAWQEELAKQAEIEAFITNLEQQANANLENREVE